MNIIKITKSFITIVIIQLFIITSLFSQNSNKECIIKLGRGINFGGYGLNTEFRFNNIGVQAFTGYKPKQYEETITIKDSYNFGVNAFYYFFNPKSPIRPKLGIHLGWLNNYYNSKIGTNNYNSNVYGAALSPGLEFGDGFIKLGINLLIDPGFAIINSDEHPFYSDNIYFSASVGIGIDIIALKKTMKNYKFNFDWGNKRKKKQLKEEKEKEENLEKEDVNNKCFILANIAGEISKGICGENVIYQQISKDKFVIVEFDNNISNYNETNIFFIKNNSYAKVYLVSGTNYNEFCSVLETTNDYVEAIEGKIILLVEEHPEIAESYKVSLTLKNLKIQTEIENETKTQIYDEIVICNLLF